MTDVANGFFANRRRARIWAMVGGGVALIVGTVLFWRDRAYTCRSSLGTAGVDATEQRWIECGDGKTRKLACSNMPPSRSDWSKAHAPAAPIPPASCQCFVDSKLVKTFQLDDGWNAVGSAVNSTETANRECGWSLALRY